MLDKDHTSVNRSEINQKKLKETEKMMFTEESERQPGCLVKVECVKTNI